ncbi:MAG TPA: SRPBCC domain-containing protein [Gemmatimonadales bacterium]
MSGGEGGSDRDAGTRSIGKEIAIAAPPDAVWRALTDAEELRRWFPADARVEPGVGGTIWVSWGGEMAWENPITIWEPGRHLRTAMPAEPGAVPFAVDYYIEARGGATILRLVNSGFGSGAEWDDMYFGMDGGWTYFLYNLRFYLERHAGKPRALAFERRPMQDRTVFPALFRALGLDSEATVAPGTPVSVPLGGSALPGTVVLSLPSHLAVEIPGLDDALLFFELEPGPAPHFGMYLSTYGTPPGRAAELEREVAGFLDRVA